MTISTNTMIKTSTLANGVHVVSKRLPGHRSAALGIWLLNGVRHEPAGQDGYAHFLEHLFFKGTANLTGPALAMRIEEMGGQTNAHTGRELTALHGLVPRDETAGLLHILIDMLLRPSFNDQDVAAEAQVILQEMAMIEDNPEEALEDRAMALAWPDQALGRPVLGRAGTVTGADAAALRRYLRQQISGGRVWVVAVGDIHHEALVADCRELAMLPPGDLAPPPAPQFAAGEHRIAIQGEQTQLLWIMPVPPPRAGDYHARLVANHILGGGVSSRLFQELRERRGLVYGIHSRLDFFSDGGTWTIQTACDPRHAGACRAAVDGAVTELLRHGFTEPELNVARRHLGANLVLDEDQPEALMERLGREAIYLGRHPDVAERLGMLSQVDAAAAEAVLAQAWEKQLFARTV